MKREGIVRLLCGGRKNISLFEGVLVLPAHLSGRRSMHFNCHCTCPMHPSDWNLWKL